ncbi:MAG: DUF4184 family protein [Myxococcales bacterium]|nr:DUF4184 family protein [Myxococcales bacterium]
MPFTIAHPVAAVPLRHLLGPYGDTTALVVGSIVPDLAYFLPLSVARSQSHSLEGLLWFCLPVGLLGYAVFFAWIAPLLSDVAPSGVRKRFPRGWSRGVPFRPRAALPVSILAGAGTHLLWDAFTHADGFVVAALPVLSVELASSGGYPVYGFKLLQHGSTLAGVVILAWWALQVRRSAPPPVAPRRASPAVRLGLLGAVLMPPAIAALAAVQPMSPVDGALVGQLQRSIGAVVFSAGAVFVASLLVVSGAWRAIRPRPGGGYASGAHGSSTPST